MRIGCGTVCGILSDLKRLALLRKRYHSLRITIAKRQCHSSCAWWWFSSAKEVPLSILPLALKVGHRYMSLKTAIGVMKANEAPWMSGSLKEAIAGEETTLFLSSVASMMLLNGRAPSPHHYSLCTQHLSPNSQPRTPHILERTRPCE